MEVVGLALKCWRVCTNLRFPFHAHDHDDGQDDDRDGADYSNVLDTPVDDGETVGGEQRVEGLAETDDVHGAGYGVGQGEDEADGAPKLGAQTSRDHVVRATQCNSVKRRRLRVLVLLTSLDDAVGADGRH